MSELRFALRSMARRPGFAFLAGLSLSIGIGANAAIYSVIDAVMLRPLPEIAHVDRLVSVVSDSVSYPAYRDIRDSSRSFAGVVGYQHRGVSILSNEGARVGVAGVVSGNFFEVLGTRPILGRTLQPSDDTAAERYDRCDHQPSNSGSSDSPAHRMHLGRLSASTASRSASSASRRRDFAAPRCRDAPDLWVPVHAWPAIATGGQRRLDLEARNWGWVLVVARLADGVSLWKRRRS